MSIRKRAAVASEARLNRSHPMLQPGRSTCTAYNFILTHPGYTMPDITNGTGINHQRVSDLVREGLVRFEGNIGNRKYYAEDGPATKGIGRDSLEVEITVSRNIHGQYSISSKLHGQLPGATEGAPVTVFTKAVNVHVPLRDEGLEDTSALTIDADFYIIPD